MEIRDLRNPVEVAWETNDCEAQSATSGLPRERGSYGFRLLRRPVEVASETNDCEAQTATSGNGGGVEYARE